MSFLISFHIKSIRFVFFWTWHFFLSCCIFCFTNPICGKSALVIIQFEKMWQQKNDMLPRIKPACRFPFHCAFQRCHVLLQIARSPTLLLSFLWLFLSYTRDFISLFVQLTVTCRGQFLPGVLRGSPRRRLNRLFSQTGSWKIEFAGGPPGPPKLFFLLHFFVVLTPLLQIYDWTR